MLTQTTSYPTLLSQRRALFIAAGTSLSVLAGLVVGCTGSPNSITYRSGEYQQILDRHKAGFAPTEEDITDTAKTLSAAELERLGDTYLRQGNQNFAIVQYQKAAEADHSSVKIHNKIGELFLKKGLPQDAALHFQEVLKKEDQNLHALEGAGESYFRMGKPEPAETMFRRVLSLQPDRWQAHNFLGMLMDKQKRHVEAIEEYERGLTVRPGEPALLNNLGLSQYLLGQYDKAVLSFGQALLTAADHPQIHNNLGLALAKLHRPQEALDSFRRASREEEAFNNLGVYFLSSGQAAQALACFKKAIALSPRYYDKAYENLALAKRSLENSRQTEEEKDRKESSACL